MDVTPPDPEDAVLVRRARRGDQDAFTALYDRHARAVYTLALRLTADAAAAEDITQDAFLRLFGFLGGLRPGAPVRPWLTRVASNLAIDRLRRVTPLPVDPLELDLQAGSARPCDSMEAIGMLRRLPVPARTLVWLHEMEGWSHAELAARFGRSESWSKSVIARALARLRLELEEETAHDTLA